MKYILLSLLIIMVLIATADVEQEPFSKEDVEIEQKTVCENVSSTEWERYSIKQTLLPNGSLTDDYEYKKVTKYTVKCEEIQTYDVSHKEEEITIKADNFGECSYVSNCLICDSKTDGNGDGVCQSGESCLKYCYTKEGLKITQKNSREDFVDDDPSFENRLIGLVEVGK